MFAALALSATPALAQYVTTGARIRLTTPAVPNEWIVGRLMALNADSLAVASAAARPRSRSAFEMSSGWNGAMDAHAGGGRYWGPR